MLPKIDLPIAETKLPSTSEVIKYRPFLVKEEKVLLMAMESEDESQMINAVKTILKNCIVSRIKVDDLVSFQKQHYVPEHSLICACGNIEHQQLVDFK